MRHVKSPLGMREVPGLEAYEKEVRDRPVIYGLTADAMEKVFRIYESIKRARLSLHPQKNDGTALVTKDGYEEAKERHRQSLTDLESNAYKCLITRLEELTPEIRWSKNGF